MSKYVQHDGYRWKVAEHTDIDGDPAYRLERRVPGEVGFKLVFARVSDCQPDAHEPIRTIKDAKGVLRYNTRTGVVTIKERGRRKGYTTTLGGILRALAWQNAANLARDRAHRRRLRHGGGR